MKKVDWNHVLVHSHVGRTEIPRFVRGDVALRSIRHMCPQGSTILSEIYKLEKMGVNRARSDARKALNLKRKLVNTL